MAQRQIVGYGPNGPVYADPAFGGTPPPADFAFGGSPSAIMPAAQSMPDAMNTPWQTQGPLGGPPATAAAVPGAPGAGNPNLDTNNAGLGGGGNALGLVPNAYSPAMANPDLMSAAYNMNNNVGPNSGVAALNSKYGNNLNYLFLLANSNNAMGASPDQYFNWANNYLQQGNTPGGSYVSSGQVMQALFSNDQTNPIVANIYAADSNGQPPTPDKIVNRFIGIMQAGLENSAPPLVINALTSMYAQAGQEWQVLTMQGKYRGSFTQYLTEKGLDPASLGMQ